MHKHIIEALEAARNPLQHVYFNAGEGWVHLCSKPPKRSWLVVLSAVWLCMLISSIASALRSLQTDAFCKCCTAAHT